MADLHAFTRELMKDAERDLGTRLDWVAVDHWNTDNPHIHVLVRGKRRRRQGPRHQPRLHQPRVSRSGLLNASALELGPGANRNSAPASKRGRGGALDQARSRAPQIADEAGASPTFDPTGRKKTRTPQLLVGRATKLERLGLAEPVAPTQWSLKPGLETALRDLGVRGDIIRTMHRAISRAGREPDVGGFALHSEEPTVPGRRTAGRARSPR